MKRPSKSTPAPAAARAIAWPRHANPVFAKNILQPLFELNARLFFHPLIAAHRAWLTMLAEEKIVPAKKAAPILRGLDRLEKDGPDSVLPFDPAVEFYYLHMELRAHSARSPAEKPPSATSTSDAPAPSRWRMVVRDALLRILNSLLAARRTLLTRAADEAETVMPGYTHLLHAQPTTLGHYLLAVHDHLERDTQRLLAAYASVDQCTLGCGAMSGTSLPVDRQRVRELLGFDQLCENTIDSVSAADHVTESAAALTNLMTIVGRLSQDLYIWSSQEFALVDVTDAFASPSSLMPQKKNALVLEYIRSRTARCIAALTGSFTVLHNVGYMDSEEVEIETCRPLFDAIALTEEALPTIDALVSVMEPNRPLMARGAAEGFSSVTALAEAIQTTRDLSYRTAHRVVARAVLLAVERSLDATGIDAALLDQAAVEMIGARLKLDAGVIARCLDPRDFVDHHAVTGAAAPKEVRRMAAARLKRIAADETAVKNRQTTLANADKTLRRAVARIIASA